MIGAEVGHLAFASLVSLVWTGDQLGSQPRRNGAFPVLCPFSLWMATVIT